MARNILPALPPEVKRFTLLESLDVSTNELQVSQHVNYAKLSWYIFILFKALPQELSELQNLTSLDLAHNSLSQLNIALPPKLRYLSISTPRLILY